MHCDNAFRESICHCIPYEDEIVVNTALTPGLELTWFITDKFEQVYSGSVTIDTDGKIHIPIAELPDGLLNQYAGVFSLHFEEVGTCKRLSIPLAKNYDEVILNIIGGNNQKNTIGCDVPCSGPGASTLINFDMYDGIITIDWTEQYSSVYGNWPTVQVYQQSESDPDAYDLVSVQVQQIRSGQTLQEIIVDNGGSANGYVVIS